MLLSHLNGYCPLTRCLSAASPPAADGSSTAGAATSLEEHDCIYFQSYSHIGIHEAMIKDRVRTDAYRTAITHHQNFIEGKVVMDVGCGTGILSVFCARAGAKRVYVVQATEMATQAREIVKANNLSNQIVVIHGRVEDVDVEEKFDVIISEWMGYMLLYESMLPSILFARDKWLKPGVSALVPLTKKFTSEEPSIGTIGGENVISWPTVIKHINCYTFTTEEFKSITTKFKVSSVMLAPVHGFGLWFEVEFNGLAESSHNFLSNLNPLDIIQKKRRRGSDDAVMLSTAPEDEPTHWQQVKQDQVIEGSITVSQSDENPQFLNINLECSTGGQTLVKSCVMR